MKTKILSLIAAFIALLSNRASAVPACPCVTNWYPIQIWYNLNLQGPWCPATLHPTPGPIIWVESIQCMCAGQIPLNPPKPPSIQLPLLIPTNCPVFPISGQQHFDTNNWCPIFGAQYPDPICPPGYPPYYNFMVWYSIQSCTNLATQQWLETGLCATSWVSAYSANTCYYSNGVPVVTNTVVLTNGYCAAGVGFNPLWDRSAPQKFFRVH